MYKNQKDNKGKILEMSQYRIITKNLVYVIGLSENIANKDTLLQYAYFGQYGKIIKMVINKKKAYNLNSPYGPSYSAYVTYSRPNEASIAILALDNIIVDNHLIRASFGTTKYCTFYLKKAECTNKECLFLHKKAAEEDIIQRHDLNNNQKIFYEQQIYAIKIADIYNPEVIRQLKSIEKINTMFPSPDEIYQSDIVKENDPKKYCRNLPYQHNHSPSPCNISNSKQRELFEDNSKHHHNHFDNKSSFIEVNRINNLSINCTTSSKDNNDLIFDFETLSNKDDSGNDEKSASYENLLSSSLSSSSSSLRQRRLYISKDKSRFSFSQGAFIDSNTNINSSNDNTTIPNFIMKIVNKSTQLLPLTKFYNNNNSHDLFAYIDKDKENEYPFDNDNKTTFLTHDNQWNDFVNFKKINPPHNNNKHKDEFIDDFDKINSFIFKQSSSSSKQ